MLTINRINKTFHHYNPLSANEIAITNDVIGLFSDLYKLREFSSIDAIRADLYANGFVYLNPLHTINFMQTYANQDGTFAFSTYDIAKIANLGKQNNVDVIKHLRSEHSEYFKSLAITKSFVKCAIEFIDGGMQKHSIECFEKEIVLLQLDETVLVYCINHR